VVGGGQLKVEGEEQASCSTETMEANMVFTIPGEVHAPEHEVMAMTSEPEEAERHMKPLFIKGNINGRLVERMMVDDGTSINIMLTLMFEKLGH
jgi:hypothetical protein